MRRDLQGVSSQSMLSGYLGIWTNRREAQTPQGLPTFKVIRVLFSVSLISLTSAVVWT